MNEKEIIIKKNNRVLFVETEKGICIVQEENEFDYDTTKEKVSKMEKKERGIEFQYGAVHLFVTRRCNMNCSFCAMNANMNVIPEKEMTINDLKDKVVPFLKMANPRKIIVTGGEPLVRSDIREIVKVLKEEVGCVIIVQSNGTLVNEKVLEKLVGYVDEIDYSIGHMLEDKGSLIENVKRTKEKVTENVVLSYVYTGNVEEMLTAFAVARELDVELMVTPVTPIGRGKDVRIDNINQLDLYINMALYILENNLENSVLVNNLFTGVSFMKSCGGLGRGLAIYPEGEVHMCKCIEDRVDYVGNAFTDKPDELLDTWKANTQKTEIRELFHVDYKEMCKNCEYRYLCGGMCGGELLQNNNESDCSVRKHMLEFMLFYYEKDLTVRDNIVSLLKYFSKKKEELLRELR